MFILLLCHINVKATLIFPGCNLGENGITRHTAIHNLCLLCIWPYLIQDYNQNAEPTDPNVDSCHFEQGIQKIFVISREIRMQRNGCDCYKQVRKNILPQFFFFVVFDIVIFHVAVIFSKARRIACVSPFSRCMNTSRSDLVVEKPKVPKFSA